MCLVIHKPRLASTTATLVVSTHLRAPFKLLGWVVTCENLQNVFDLCPIRGINRVAQIYKVCNSIWDYTSLVFYCGSIQCNKVQLWLLNSCLHRDLGLVIFLHKYSRIIQGGAGSKY